MKSCVSCKQGFEVDEDFRIFLEKMAVVIGKRRLEIDEPVLCKDCRLQRRFAWRNDRQLYKRKCDVTGKELITMYSEDSYVPVVDKDYWWSDKWDGREYGVDFDFNKPFFEQFGELLKRVPQAHALVASNKNSDYSNYAYNNNNCYLCFAGNFLKDSYYCYMTQNSSDCVDSLFAYDTELGYELTHSSDCYNVKFSLHSSGCRDSAFLEDCKNCSDCFFCWNLTNAQYCILNKQYTKEEYEKLMASYDLGNYEILKQFKERFYKERNDYFKPEDHNISAENCSGEYILNSKNCRNCYIIGKGGEDLCNIVNAFPGLKDSADCCYSGEKSSLMYECMGSGEVCYRMAFNAVAVINCSEVYYSTNCFTVKNVFGCTSLKNSEYCILNKQYTQEEYEQLVPKIIGHMKKTGEWGQFMDPKYSPFGYNETLAMEYFPLSEEEASLAGFGWKQKDPREYLPQTYKGSYDIDKVDESVTKSVFACKKCTKNYRVIE